MHSLFLSNDFDVFLEASHGMGFCICIHIPSFYCVSMGHFWTLWHFCIFQHPVSKDQRFKACQGKNTWTFKTCFKYVYSFLAVFKCKNTSCMNDPLLMLFLLTFLCASAAETKRLDSGGLSCFLSLPPWTIWSLLSSKTSAPIQTLIRS